LGYPAAMEFPASKKARIRAPSNPALRYSLGKAQNVVRVTTREIICQCFQVDAAVSASGVTGIIKYYVPRWAVLTLGSFGWLLVLYLVWRDEHQKALGLQRKLDCEQFKERKESDKRKLIRIVTALRQQKEKVLYWREFVESRWGGR
jgi:hypothetical protein